MPPLPPPAAEAAALFAQGPSPLLYYVHVPLLIILISLVYSATRFDEPMPILREALRWGLRLALFLCAIGFALFLVSRF